MAAVTFEFPRGLVVDGAGNLLVADENNHRICAIHADGRVSTIAGSRVRGFADGPSEDAQFHGPRGMAVDAAGVVYVADARNHRIRKISPDGTVGTLAGCGPGHVDGAAADARFDFPFGLACDPAGNMYVADENNHCLRRISVDGTVSTLAGRGSRTSCGYLNGAGDAAAFNFPRGLAFDAAGSRVLLADENNHCIRAITLDGTVSTLAGSSEPGFVDGPADRCCFNAPRALAIDGEGSVYVADARNHAIRKVSRDGSVSTFAGSGKAGHADGAAADAQFDYPFGLAIYADGSILCADENNHSIRKISVDGVVSTLAGRQPSRRSTATPPASPAGGSRPPQPPASPAGGSLAQKVARIKAALELSASLSFRQALLEANELMGLQPAAAEPLPSQADALLAAIGV